MMSAQRNAVRTFYDAFNAQDLDAFAALLAPDVEIQSARGVREGIEEAKSWATRTPGGMLVQSVALDDLLEHESRVVALIRRQWRWKEDGEPAEEEELATMFTFRDGKIVRVQPFEDRDEAIRVAGLE